MSGNPVVITRPLAQAEPLAARLTGLGIRAHVFPLLEIQPLPDAPPLTKTLAQLADYALVAFVSPNAIDAAFDCLARHPELLQGGWPAGTIAAVVGEGSRQALARHGVTAGNAQVVSPADPHRTDSETLLEVLDLPALQGRRVLIVRAETGRELLADRLREAGAQVEQVAAYRRGPMRLDDARRAQLMALIQAGADWVITSSEALRYLKDDVMQTGGDTAWRQMQCACLVIPHPRIAETAQALGFTHVLRSGSGDDALIAALQSRP